MDLKSLLACVDHTLLGITATETEYKNLCEEALTHCVASVCVPPSRVKFCAELLKKTTSSLSEGSATGVALAEQQGLGQSPIEINEIAICTVVGFPNGYSCSEVKAYESKLAIKHGATEIDMVIDIGKAKEKDFDSILKDIQQVREATKGYILKVIIETAVLSYDEKVALCKVVSDSGADFIKTSTGFSSAGATSDDVALLRAESASHVKVKAAGGITSLEDAFHFVELGADRLGTSRIVKIVQGMDGIGY